MFSIFKIKLEQSCLKFEFIYLFIYFIGRL